jgi:hypothetical protein
MKYRYLLGVILPAISSVALGVNTSSWTDTAEADFAEGQMSSVVASSLGELKLSRATRPLIAENPLVDIVYAIRPATDGSVYLSTGPRGSVLQYRDGKPQPIYKAGDNALVTALAVDAKGQVLAGISGANARLVRIDPATGNARDLYKGDEVQFIWAIQPMPDGTVLLGTGPTGQLLEISPEGKSRVVFQSKESNVLCILPGENDEVLVGTDPEGLVIRVNRKTGDWFILYDAEESEIVALARDGAGRIYAAASAPVEPTEGEPSTPGAPGRPEAGTELPLHREAPAVPEPPKLPDPTPGEPEPIPKQPSDPVKHMSIGEAKPARAKLGAPTSQPATGPQVHLQGPQSRPSGQHAEGPTSNSSAIYRIDNAGFVHEVFRKPVTIHSMVLSDSSLLLGTGPEGLVYQVNPETQETFVLARADSHDVSSMAIAPDGRILLGLSNPGGLIQMDAGYAAKGTYTSQMLDAQQVARFGKLQLQGTLSAATALTVSTRSGNVRDPEIGGWSKWSDEMPAAEFIQIASPAARFFQYRLSLSTKDPRTTPTIEEIKVNYLIPNMPPKIDELKIEPETVEPDASGKTTSPGVHHITWQTSDPNDDRLTLSLYYRMGYRGEWVLLKDKVKEDSFDWNTRQLADGRYQIKLVASDAPSNPAGEGLTATRYSDPVIVDNTGPVIGDLKTEVRNGQVQVSLRAIDRTGTVAGVEYSLDASDDWQAASSSDMLYDSPDETVRFAVSKLGPGQHQLTVRARDSYGNTTYETLIVTIDQPEKKK